MSTGRTPSRLHPCMGRAPLLPLSGIWERNSVSAGRGNGDQGGMLLITKFVRIGTPA